MIKIQGGQTAERASLFTQTLRPGNSGTDDRAATVGPRRIGALLRVHSRSVYRLAPLRPDTQDEGRYLYIGVIKDHVNLGFIRGSELADPQRILEGTGKQMRHIKIRNMSDLLRPAIRAYLQEACERAGYEVATEKERTVTTVVKRKSLPKRTAGTTRV